MSGSDSGELLLAEFHDLGRGARLLQLEGEIDPSSAHILTDHFHVIVTDKPSHVVIDATKVTFMDSTGLHALVEGKRLLHESGIKIALVSSPQVRRVLELVFPDPLFAARVDSVKEALKALGRDEEAAS